MGCCSLLLLSQHSYLLKASQQLLLNLFVLCCRYIYIYFFNIAFFLLWHLQSVAFFWASWYPSLELTARYSTPLRVECSKYCPHFSHHWDLAWPKSVYNFGWATNIGIWLLYAISGSCGYRKAQQWNRNRYQLPGIYRTGVERPKLILCRKLKIRICNANIRKA